jgi:hypothetical protein
MKSKERIIGDKLAVIRWIKKFEGFPFYPNSDEAIAARAEAIAHFVNNTTFQHPELGEVNDLDWVMGVLLKEADKCPLPSDVFSLHNQKFPAYDEMEKKNVS